MALGVNASVYPWGPAVAGHGLTYTAVSGPAVVPAWGNPHASVAIHAANPWAYANPWGYGAWPAAAPALHVASHAAAPAVVVAPGHEGSYIAKTRGAVHKAPLAGHVQSVASVNVAPAPGTV